MLRRYCDRCKKQCKMESRVFNDALCSVPVGSYSVNIFRVEGSENSGEKWMNGLDLCDKCQKELNEYIIPFMKKDCKK